MSIPRLKVVNPSTSWDRSFTEQDSAASKAGNNAGPVSVLNLSRPTARDPNKPICIDQNLALVARGLIAKNHNPQLGYGSQMIATEYPGFDNGRE